MADRPLPTDADFDQMHHALGRPAGSHVEPYRNYYAVDPDGPDAKRFQVLDLYWTRGRSISGGLVAFHVTPQGIRNALAWVDMRNRAQGKRPWIVYGGGLTTRVVIARSPHAAKYDVWLEVSDVLQGDFGDFLKLGVRARAA
jgi:hypothetical protein